MERSLAGVCSDQSLVYAAITRWCMERSLAGVCSDHSQVYVAITRWWMERSLAGVWSDHSQVYVAIIRWCMERSLVGVCSDHSQVYVAIIRCYVAYAVYLSMCMFGSSVARSDRSLYKDCVVLPTHQHHGSCGGAYLVHSVPRRLGSRCCRRGPYIYIYIIDFFLIFYCSCALVASWCCYVAGHAVDIGSSPMAMHGSLGLRARSMAHH